ncbi:MAG: Ig-like domain-containing protein [Eubacterium sp.]|nr:Ig-like domain-containing protein [Eubacterium sp.]
MRKRTERMQKRIIGVALVLCMAGTLLSGYQKQKIQAADTAFESSISAFPESYKTYLRTLHTKYPKWKFVAYNTGISFQTAVSAEYSKDRSLIENNFSKLLKSNENSSNYNASTGTYIAKDGGSWVVSSKNCVAYFMDPRNFLDEEHIYMFEKLSYDSATQNQSGVEAILKNSFMYKTNIGYLTSAGKYKSTNTLYSSQIMNTAKKTNVSAYYIASKIVQEIGTKKHSKYEGMGASGSVNGNYSKTYAGIYNFYNIGAYSSSDPISNGLKWASSGSTFNRPWTTPMKSIEGGAMYIGEQYINAGQNTIYFQRFNVNKSSKYALYDHQYMTNIYGAANEAALTYNAYEDLGIISLAKTFVIPVYSNMPTEGNTIKYGKSTTKATITSAVNLRKKASTAGTIVTTLAKGDVVKISKAVMTSEPFGWKWLSNPYWYKVKIKKSGKSYSGYIVANYATVNQEYDVIKGNKTTLPITLKKSETVYYRSDNPAVATVDSNGNINGKKNGTVTIFAFTQAGRFAASSVNVLSNGCTFNKKSLEMNVNSTATLKTTVYPKDATNKTVTYQSSNKAVATVNSKGKITAKAPGTVKITATAATGGVKASCSVKVVQPATKITLNKTKTTLSVGGHITLQGTISPSNATYKTVRYSSSNTAVATVDGKGTVRAVSAGVATITAKTHNNLSAICEVKVKPARVVATAKSTGYQSVKLQWAKTANLTGYKIYRKSGNGKYQCIASLAGTAYSYKDQTLRTGVTYTYKVKAFRTVGKRTYNGKKSKAVSVKPIPKKTKIKSATVVGGRVQLTWKEVTGASGYDVFRRQGTTGKYVKIKNLAGIKNISYTDKKTVAGNVYYYKIIVYNNSSVGKVNSKFSKKYKVKR